MGRENAKELRVRLTDAEYTQIQNNAARCGLTISDYVRKLIREEPLIQKPKQDSIEHFRSLQMFKATLEDALADLPREKCRRIMPALDKLLLESKMLI